MAMRFAETFCSQCGRGFGPGDHGFSHCDDHPGFKHDQKRANQIAALESALNSCLEYLDGKVDVVDGSYGIPEPNREMSLVNEINIALGRGGY